MRCVDVNVLIRAFREDTLDHARYKEWLEAARRDPEPLGLPGVVLSGFVRIVTNPRVFKEPSPVDTALRFVDALDEGPSTLRLEPGQRHWSIFASLCRRVNARGNLVPDAYIAALAIETGATLTTTDRGFARFPDLRWRHPLD